MYHTDLISDYMVSVAVVAGDWTNYKNLSVDPRWSKYFSPNGLRKTQIGNFLNDNAVSRIAFYDVSLLPYFKDQQGRNMFIETVINRDTDSTGLFVAYDIDAVETDYPNGLIDLIGHTVAGASPETIEYLSYKEKISEFVSFDQVLNDSAGNIFKEASGELSGNSESAFTSGPLTFSIASQTGTSLITLTSTDTAIVLNGINTPIVNAQELNITNVNSSRIRKDTIYVDTVGKLGVAKGNEVSNLTSWANAPLKAIPAGTYPVAIAEVGTQGTSGGLGVSYIYVLPDITISSASTSGADILISQTSSYDITITFTGTKNSDPDSEYIKTRLMQIFNTLKSVLVAGTSLVTTTTGNKKIQAVEFTTDSTEDKAIKISVLNTLTINPSSFAVMYKDLSFTIGTNGSKTETTSGYGTVGSDSAIYKAYTDGIINTGDFFYPQLINPASSGVDHIFKVVEFTTNGSSQSQIDLYTNVVISTSADDEFDATGGDLIYINGTVNNDKVYTILSYASATGSFVKGGATYVRKYTFVVDEAITAELNTTGVTIHEANPDKLVYLKMYLINDKLNIEFVNSDDIANAGAQTSANYAAYNPSIRIHSDKSNFKQSLEIEAVLEINQFLINTSRYGEVKVGDYMEAYIDTTLDADYYPKKLTRVVKKTLWPADPTLALITTDAQIKIYDFGGDKQTYRYSTIENYVQNYQATVLSGFKVRQDSMPDGTETRQNAILNLLAPATALYKGLINKNHISWRYLIDAFGLGLTANSKQQLVDLCGAKLNCLGILNMPSAKAFKNSSSPNFLDPNTKTLSTKFVSLGGDPESNPSFLYSFGQGDGQSCVAYFFPYLTIDDNGRPLNMPPASFVANTFMNKHNTRQSDIHPWTIAAGITNGRITGVGNVEVDFNDEDIEFLNDMNANPIVFKMNQGFCIETNNTAQVSPKSSLSLINSREVLIELENELYNMLLQYQWKFNTPDIRNEIQQKADTICNRYVANDGLYAFLNKCDDTNNTGEIIDAQIGVLDTYVEITKGMAIIVNRVSVTKTGDIASGGFKLNTTL
jgi:hypothetical protein